MRAESTPPSLPSTTTCHRVPPDRLPAQPVDPARLNSRRARHVPGLHHRLPGQAWPRGGSPHISRPTLSPTSTPQARGATILPASPSPMSPRPSLTFPHPAGRIAVEAASPRTSKHYLDLRPAVTRTDARPLPSSMRCLCRRLQRNGQSRALILLRESRCSQTTCTSHSPCPSFGTRLILKPPAPPRSRSSTPPESPFPARPLSSPAQPACGLGLHQSRRRRAGPLHRAHPRHASGAEYQTATACGAPCIIRPRSFRSAAAPTSPSMCRSPTTVAPTRPSSPASFR